jgi:hypothetical protein
VRSKQDGDILRGKARARHRKAQAGRSTLKARLQTPSNVIEQTGRSASPAEYHLQASKTGL